MDLFDWYFKQIVTQAQMDWAFDRVQNAIHGLSVDDEMLGIVDGLAVAQHAPMPDKTVDITGPGKAYDPDGQRIYVGDALSVVDCEQDEFGTDTNPPTLTFQRYISVFARFKRNLTEPALDGNNIVVYTKQLESFEFFVRIGAEAPAGTAIPAPIMADAVLLADILVTNGFTAILNADIDLSRRQDWVRFSGTVLGDLAYGTAHDAVLDILNLIESWGGALPFAFTQTWFGGLPVGGPTPPPTTIQEALNAIVYDLGAVGPPAGDALVSATDFTGFFVAWAGQSVSGALAAAAGALDAHIGGAAPQHPASSIVFTPYSWIAAVQMQAVVQEIVDDLAVNGVASSGASLVGWFDNVVAGLLNGVIGNTTVQGAIKALAEALQATAPTSGAARIGTAAIAGSPESIAASDVMAVLTAIYGHLNDRTERATNETVSGYWRFAGTGTFLDKARSDRNVRFDDAPFIRSVRGGPNQPLSTQAIQASGLGYGLEWASPFSQFNGVSAGGAAQLQDICVVFTAGGNRKIVIADDASFSLLIQDPERATLFSVIPLAPLFPAGTWGIDSICSDGTHIYVKVTDYVGFTHRINACDQAGVLKAGWPATGTVLPGVGVSPLGITHVDKMIVTALDGALAAATELVTTNSWQHCASGLSMSRIDAATGAILQNGDGDGPVIAPPTPSNCYPSGGLFCDGTNVFATFKDSTAPSGGIYSAQAGNVVVGSGLLQMPYSIPAFDGQCIVGDGAILWCVDSSGDIYTYSLQDQAFYLKQGAAAIGTARFAVFDGLNIWLQELDAAGVLKLHMLPALQYHGVGAGQTLVTMVRLTAGMTKDSEIGAVVANQMGRLCFDGDSVWMIMRNVGAATLSGVVRRIPMAGLR